MFKAKKLQLSRRTFLGGAAAVISLPFLEVMTPFGSEVYAAGSGVRRMIPWYTPCGIHMAEFTPDRIGANYDLKQILTPLSDVQDYVSVVSGFYNRPARPDGAGDHAAGTGSFLTATHVKKTEGSDIQNAISVDQVAARAIATGNNATSIESLQIGLDGGGSAGGCDSGYSCAYARNISWAGPQSPLPKESNPLTLFNRLFSGFDSGESAAEQAKREKYNLSVLDYAIKDVNRLNAKLGAWDKAKLEEYLTGVRALEVRIADLDPASMCGIPTEPDGSYEVTEKAEIMADIITVALQCDITRVASFMLANAGSGRRYNFLGIPDGHHDLSHHQSQQANFDKLTTIGRWEIEQFAYLLKKLKNTDDGAGKNLLDSTTLFCSSEITDGNRHNHNDMPVLIAGGSDYFKLGQHIVLENEPALGNFFLTWLDYMGVQQATFGDGTQKVPQIVI